MRIYVDKVYGYDDGTGKKLHYIEASGDSSETKPTGDDVGGIIGDGSICTESDSGNVFFFNEKTSAWKPQFSFQSGS